MKTCSLANFLDSGKHCFEYFKDEHFKTEFLKASEKVIRRTTAA